MTLYPKLYYRSVKEITIEELNKNNIKGLILDVDNTLIDFNKIMPEGIKEWFEEIKKNSIKAIILSNSNKEEKVRKVADTLGIEYIKFAKKPLKSGFRKAKDKLNLKEENIAVIGDQIFTDVVGANRSKMFSILVEPIGKKDHIITRVKRPFENFIIKKFLQKRGK